MLIYIFLFIVVIHAFVHLGRFTKAFSHARASFSFGTTKPIEWASLSVFAMLSVMAFLLLLNNTTWCWLAIAAAIVSQVLIIGNWKPAKWGTIVNLVILLAAMPTVANSRFNSNANKVSKTILARVGGNQNILITKERLTGLPPIVQKWLVRSGVIGNNEIYTVRLRQEGELRITAAGRWMPFTATEYFTVNEPAFAWTAHVSVMPSVYFTALDKFENAAGASAIKLFALYNMGSASNDYKTNTATMLRYLAETCLFPSAAFGKYITWEAIDTVSAKATMIFKGTTVSGIFTFSENGDVLSFVGKRFYGNGVDAKQEPWQVQFSTWKTFQGYTIPVKSKVTWQLPTGDFYWANFEITALEYNCTGIYD